MQVSSVNQGLPFKAAQVKSSSPLVSGDWLYLENGNKGGKTDTPAKKKSHWLRNTLIAAAAIALVSYGLIKGRQSEAISRVMDAGYENLTSKTDKLKYCVGKLGDWVGAAYNKTIGKVVNFVKDKLPHAASGAPDLTDAAGDIPAGTAI